MTVSKHPSGLPSLTLRRLTRLGLGLLLVAGCGKVGPGVLASGSFLSPPSGLALRPVSLDFSVQSVGTSSSPQRVELTNTGAQGEVVQIGAVQASPADFVVSGPALPLSLAPGESVVLKVQFAPHASGPVSGSLTLSGGNLPGSYSVGLAGAGSDLPGLSAEAPYSAISDRKVRPEGNPPPLGRAGYRFQDPDFGSREVRVTDRLTWPELIDRLYVTPSSSEQNTWNTTSTLFYVVGQGGYLVAFRFDPATMKASPLGRPVPLAVAPTFSYVDPDLMYGLSQTQPLVLQSYRISNGKLRTVHEFKSCVSIPRGATPRDVTVSGDDGRLLAYVGGATQDNDFLVYVYDRERGCRWWNTKTGEIGGQWGPTGSASTQFRLLVHNARISKDGRYARISPGSHSDTGDLLVWDIETLEVTACPGAKEPFCDGHMTMGYNYLINQRELGDNSDFALRPLADLRAVRSLVQPLLTPTERVQGSHPSWNNAKADILVPVCAAYYRSDRLPVKRPWDNEIICLRTDGKESQVWRFAHTYSTNADFTVIPKGNVSQDGRFFMFSSDWMGHLGQTRSGRRTDVFIVELK